MNIHTLDLHFQDREHAIASYLLEGPSGHVLVETGPSTTLDALRAALARHGLEPADIRHVLVTHIHLDHAGASGWWARQGAQIYVHEVGAPHLIDPSKLLASAGRIYGDQMDTLWGPVLPAPAERVTALKDGDRVQVAGLTLTAIDTPGHAWHHHTYRLEDIAFTGDAAGVRLAGSDWISVPAPPPEFKYEVWLATLDKLQAADFAAIYPTHFGCVDDPTAHFERFRAALEAATTFVHDRMRAGQDREAILREYVAWNERQAVASDVSPVEFRQFEAANPLFMSVDGIMRYWRKRFEREG